MSLIKGLRDKPSRLTVASKYTALNGIGYLVVGAILIVWPGVTQAFFLHYELPNIIESFRLARYSAFTQFAGKHRRGQSDPLTPHCCVFGGTDGLRPQGIQSTRRNMPAAGSHCA
jgi:hypothetical protein